MKQMQNDIGLRVVIRAVVILGCICVMAAGRCYGTERRKRPAPELTDTATLSDYLEFAVLNNPGLEAAWLRWKAELGKVPQARSMPDPRFTYRYYIDRVETRVGPQRQSFALAQTFPWFGKLKLHGMAVMESANAAKQRYEAEKLNLFQRVKSAYYEYYYLSRALAVVGETRELLVYLEEVVRSRYSTGEAEYKDLIRAQVELGILDDRLDSLMALRRPLVTRLNAALNRPAEASLPWPTDISEARLAHTDEGVLALVAERNPDLGAAGHEVVRQTHAIALAKKSYYPDLTVGLNYIDTGAARMSGASGSGDDPLIAMVSINLPLWRGKYAASVREAEARRLAAVRSKTELKNNLVARATMALYRLRDAERKMGLYRDTLIPKAKQTLTVTETSYRAGKASFTDLIDAERIMLDFELSFERALADHAQHLAELEMLAGQELPRSGPVPAQGEGDVELEKTKGEPNHEH